MARTAGLLLLHVLTPHSYLHGVGATGHSGQRMMATSLLAGLHTLIVALLGRMVHSRSSSAAAPPSHSCYDRTDGMADADVQMTVCSDHSHLAKGLSGRYSPS
jgi:hypothetical protein